MKRRFGFFFKLLFLIVIVGAATCFIDYTRVLNNEEPLFALKSYDSKSKVSTYRGLFYKIERKITISPDESMKDSKNITFKVLIYELSLKTRVVNTAPKLSINYTRQETCTNPVLIHATQEFKVYSYCLENIEFKENNKVVDYANFFKTKKFVELLPYYGLDNDKTTEVYLDNEKYVKENQGIKVFKCNNDQDRKSIYITPSDITNQPFFCIYKDDDFIFTYKIENNNPADACKVEEGAEPLQPEVFFEDDVNQYTFDCYMSGNIKLVNYQKELMLVDALNSNQVTIDSLKNKGLKFNTVKK